ncbi:MAG: alpha-amylase family glycosyl hydrolase [Chloroherpetonaceae bacterium]|nr:alpha-amylase family glycosyl hydrolase [Chloroherpetonaceae bacterium]
MNAQKFPIIYEINTRVWIKNLIADGKATSLENIPDSFFQKWKESRFDAVWLMGVWKPSEPGRRVAVEHPGLWTDYRRTLSDPKPEDVVCSPYCIQDYSVADSLGGKNALLKFRDRLHKYGLKLILDFVPNHVALDHHWVSTNPEFFIQASERVFYSSPESYFSIDHHHLAHGKDPYFPAWTDTLQLNYANKGLQAAIIDTLKKIAALCDGVRCDMAMLELKRIFNQTWGWIAGEMENEFWDRAIREVKGSHPQFLFIAEAYWDTEWNLHQLGFDYTYDKRFYDRLVTRDISGLKQHLQASQVFQQKLVRFIENHDEPRAASVFGVFNKAAGAIAATSLGARLFHDGQFEGKRIKLPVQLIRTPEETTDADTEFYYENLLRILDNPAFVRGELKVLELQGQSAQVLGFERLAGANTGRAMTIANFGDSTAEVHFFTDAFKNVTNYEHIEIVSSSRFNSPQFDLWEGGITIRIRSAEALIFILS